MLYLSQPLGGPLFPLGGGLLWGHGPKRLRTPSLRYPVFRRGWLSIAHLVIGQGRIIRQHHAVGPGLPERLPAFRAVSRCHGVAWLWR